MLTLLDWKMSMDDIGGGGGGSAAASSLFLCCMEINWLQLQDDSHRF